MTMLEWPAPGASATGGLTGPAGLLDAQISVPEQHNGGGAVICHPHPQYGGTRDNKVVYTLARACNDAGLAALRFDFRGVRASEGRYDEGHGEADDARAAADWLGERIGSAQLVLAGFSFGAAVALRVASQSSPARVVTIALPTRYFEQEGLPQPQCPWLAVHGDADDVVDTPAATDALRNLQPPPVVETLDGAGHFFHGRLTELRKRVTAFLECEQSGQ